MYIYIYIKEFKDYEAGLVDFPGSKNCCQSVLGARHIRCFARNVKEKTRKRYVGGLRHPDDCEHVYISTPSPAWAGRVKQQGWCVGDSYE